MSGSNNHRKSGGFTLIELTLAVTIFALIAVSIYSTFAVGLKIWRQSTPLIEKHQSRIAFFNVVSTDLRHAFAYRKTPENPSALTDPVVNFEGASQKMSFMSLVSVYDPARGLRMEPAKIIYSYDQTHQAVRRLLAGKNEGFEESAARPAEVLEGIEAKDFGIEYCYKKTMEFHTIEWEWKNTWADEMVVKVPRGVRVRVGEYIKTIFIPAGELGQ